MATNTTGAPGHAEPSENAASRAWRALRGVREISIIMAFLVLLLFFYWQRPDVFFKQDNFWIIERFVATFGLLAIGELMVIVTGGIDLSVGSVTALTGVLGAVLMLKGVGPIPPLTIGPAIVVVLCVGALIGLWHGFFVTKLRIPAFIITLGTWLIARGLAAFITRGYPVVYPSNSPFLVLGQGVVSPFPVMFYILLAFAFLAAFILDATTLGRHIYAIGGNIEAARVSGINVDRTRMFSYATCSVLASLVGILLASRLGQGTPTVGSGYELWAIAATVIGGASLFGGEGTVLGAVLGAAIMGVIFNGMVLLNVSSYLQDVVLGLVVVVSVTYDTWRRRRRR